jgi:hypothetical protein
LTLSESQIDNGVGGQPTSAVRIAPWEDFCSAYGEKSGDGPA